HVGHPRRASQRRPGQSRRVGRVRGGRSPTDPGDRAGRDRLKFNSFIRPRRSWPRPVECSRSWRGTGEAMRKKPDAVAKIEITPEMLEAGACELYQDDYAETKEEWAARVFRAMVRVAFTRANRSFVPLSSEATDES